MVWLEEQVQDAIENVLGGIRDALLGFSNDMFTALLKPIVGVEAPASNSGYFVIGEPDNSPWDTLYSDFYMGYILPLTLMLSTVALAYVGLRAGSISSYRRKRLLRRIGIVFLGSFVWLPLVSLPLQLVDDIGLVLAPVDQMSAGFGAMIKSGVGGLFVVLLVAFVSNMMLFVAGFLFAIRWLGIVVLTLMMPLIGVLWAMDIWPLSPASHLASRAAGIYPGLVLAGIPAAVLFQIGWQMQITSSVDGIFSLLLGLALIPSACLASILTVYWSAPAIRTIARGSARQTNPSSAASTAKSTTGSSIRGARNVHRGYSQNAHGAVTKDGQTTLGSGSSAAYAIGSGVRSARGHGARYNELRKSPSERMRTQMKADVGRAKDVTTVRSKRAFRKTKEKVSRW